MAGLPFSRNLEETKMKKLLLATAIAASAIATTAQAALVEINYNVDMTAVISGGSVGSQAATGLATIVVDDVANMGWFAMELDGYTSSTSLGSTLSADVSQFITGTFDPLVFLGGGGLVITDGVSEVTACTDTTPPVFGNTVCSNAPVGSTTVFSPFNVDATNVALVTLQNELNVSAPFVGNVNTLQSFTLSLNPASGQLVKHPTAPDGVSEVPVPAAAWLFGSALVGLAGIGRKRKMA
jgi:hypothetical protein